MVYKNRQLEAILYSTCFPMRHSNGPQDSALKWLKWNPAGFFYLNQPHLYVLEIISIREEMKPAGHQSSRTEIEYLNLRGRRGALRK